MSKVKLEYYFFLAILLSQFLYSCKVSEKENIKVKVKPRSAKYIVQKLHDNEFRFNTISAKSTISFDNGKKRSFKAHLRIKKDSAIWISITPLLGIEVARVLITRDTVKLLNRSSSEYFVGDFDYLSHILSADMDYQMIEALILGNSLDFEINDRLRSSVDRGKNLYFLSTEKKRKVKVELKKEKDKLKKQTQVLWLDPKTFKIKELLLSSPQTNRTMTGEYSDYNHIEDQLLPHHLFFSMKSETKNDLEIKYSKFSLNKSMTFPFKIPSKYVHIRK